MFSVSKNIRISLVAIIAFVSIFFVSVPKKDFISHSNNDSQFNQVTTISPNEEMFIQIEMLMMTASTLFTPTIEDRNNSIDSYTLQHEGNHADLASTQFDSSSATFWAKQITYTYDQVNDSTSIQNFTFKNQQKNDASFVTPIIEYVHYVVEQTANDAQKNLYNVPNSIIRQTITDNLTLLNLEQSINDINNYLITCVISSPLYLSDKITNNNNTEYNFFSSSEKTSKNKYYIIEIIIAIVSILGLILLMGYKLQNNRRSKK
ncbi:hypothetical protein ASO20_00295 [Mycoplasma sp. (ex Biomphalaria glabrata)]|uniref:hypothetical protein n=1 Tax=Mycoplasma sp. (ex Biomphalaria glabrata) TaxID=1749074 RepID=UPI00073A65EB|nr:hypothetical protein [Mycoplasma sp. (ex Biomphalaria glabrata)]ALV23121.1 hypothetical protein ASO20_00295 [Mycoplasma sp. (ex Biomphalaria glabrata)]